MYKHFGDNSHQLLPTHVQIKIKIFIFTLLIPRQSLYTSDDVLCRHTRLLQPITGCISYTGLYVMTGGRYIDIVINVHSYQCRYFLCILYKRVGKSVRWASELGSVTNFSTISNSRKAMTNNV